jgi:hypothetical protein
MKKPTSYTSSFKILTGYLLLILCICIIAGWVFDKVFESQVIFNNQISGAAKINRINNETHPEEIPIFGSSRAQGCYVPSILGNNFFNYGIDGVSANITNFFLENELNKPKNTPIIINLDFTGITAGHGDIGNYIANYDKTKHLLPAAERSIFYNVPFVRYFGKYESYFKFYLNEKLNITKVTNHGGSFEKNALTPKKFRELTTKRSNTPSRFYLNAGHTENLLKLLKSSERKIIVVVAPYHSSYFNRFENPEEASSFLNKIQQIRNVEVVNFSRMHFNDSLYFDTSHLNYEGAKLFSDSLRQHLSHCCGLD